MSVHWSWMRAFSCKRARNGFSCCHGDGAISTAMMHKMNNELLFISPYEAGRLGMWFSWGFYGLAAATAATRLMLIAASFDLVLKIPPGCIFIS
jgi:hypothetical protein